MEEVALRWIERVGFPIFVALCSMYAMYKLFMRSEGAIQRLFDATEGHAQKVAEVSNRSNAALGQNTLATQELSETIKKKLGSDPQGLCRAQMALAEAGLHLKVEEIIKILKQQGKYQE